MPDQLECMPKEWCGIPAAVGTQRTNASPRASAHAAVCGGAGVFIPGAGFDPNQEQVGLEFDPSRGVFVPTQEPTEAPRLQQQPRLLQRERIPPIATTEQPYPCGRELIGAMRSG